jgi:hypothetical protein
MLKILLLLLATEPTPKTKTWTGYYSQAAAQACWPVTVWRDATGREYLVTEAARGLERSKWADAVRYPPLVAFVGFEPRADKCKVLKKGQSR